MHALACIWCCMAQETLIHEIEEFLRESGMSAYRFGFLAVRNGRLVDRLSKGGRVWPETERAVREFMAQRIAASSIGQPSSRGSA